MERKCPESCCKNTKKQVRFLIKIEKFAAKKPRKEIFNATTDAITSFHVIYYKDPTYCFLFVIFCPAEERWLLSTKVTDSHQQ